MNSNKDENPDFPTETRIFFHIFLNNFRVSGQIDGENSHSIDPLKCTSAQIPKEYFYVGNMHH